MNNLTEISIEQIVAKAQELFNQGYRFVTIDCIQVGDGQWQLLYHYDKDLQLVHFRVAVEGDTVPSISGVYLCALLVENEIQDLFGLSFTGLVLNYEGRLMITEQVGPAPQVISNMVVQITDKQGRGETDGGQ